MPATVAARITPALLRAVLRLSPAEATARVRAAHGLGPRETVTGEVLPPVFAVLAAAQTAGAVSAEQARVITATIEELPAAVRLDYGPDVEATLVDAAERFDPGGAGPAGSACAGGARPGRHPRVG